MRPIRGILAVTALGLCGACATSDATPATTPASASPPASASTLTTTPATTPATAPATAPATVDASAAEMPRAFCDAKAEFDALDSDTPDEASLQHYLTQAVPAMQAVADAAPPDITAAAASVVAELQSFTSLDVATAAHEDDSYNGARATIAMAVHDQCGYQPLTFEVANNAVVTAPDTATVGPASVLLISHDHDVHVLIFARLHDGVTADQLMADPDAFEAGADIVNVVLAGARATDGIVLNLEAGSYVYFDPQYLDDGLAGSFDVS